MNTQILNHTQVLLILRRMAYQIAERNIAATDLVLAGIEGQGRAIADLLEAQLLEIAKFKIQRISVKLNKEAPLSEPVKLEPMPILKKHTVVVLCDDVLNSGRTLIYAIQPFLKQDIASVQVAVLVDRSYKSYPVAANFIGTSLSTTLQEHVSVEVKRNKFSVYLE